VQVNINIKGCDSYFEVKCLNFKSCYKLNNLLALIKTICIRIALENYNNNLTDVIFADIFYLDPRAVIDLH